MDINVRVLGDIPEQTVTEQIIVTTKTVQTVEYVRIVMTIINVFVILDF
jgi:hypothetical protein